MAPAPPLAAAVLVIGMGVPPRQTVWPGPMLPAFSAGSTVMVTTLEMTGPQEPDVTRRR